MSGALAIAIGLVGGLGVSVLKLLELLHVPKVERAADFSDPLYWLDLAWRPVIGGVVAWLHWSGNQQITALATFQLGASAPLLIKAFSSLTPEERPEKTD